MTRDFPDELLSAFLDDELSPAERAQVERHLAASPADRQLLAELRTLRGEVASLPAPTLRPDFADRVVRAAIAEAETNNGARGVVTRAPPVKERHSWRRWKIRAAVASAAALAACALLAVFFSGEANGPHQVLPEPAIALVGPQPAAVAVAAQALPEQLLAALAPHVAGNQDAVVLRLRANKDVPVGEALDAALAAAGLNSPVGSSAASAAWLERAYQQSLAAKASDASATAARAVFIECPVERLQNVANQLASNIRDPLRLETCGTLALGREWNELRAEGEASAAPIAQQLNATLFKLQRSVENAVQAATASQPVAAIDPQQRVRVLLLVEAAE